MVSKNNYQQITKKLYVEKQHWGLRKLSIGVASVLLGMAIMAPEAVHADNKTTTLTNGMATTSETASDQESPASQTTENNNSVVLKTSSVAPDSTVKPSSEVQNSSAPTSNEKNEANSDPEDEPTASNSSELNVNSLTELNLNVNSLTELNQATGAALNTNLTQASDDSTIVKPSAPITDDSFKGQTLEGNKALIGTGKPESIQLNDNASLSINNNVLFAGDTDKKATLTFSASGSAGSSYQIVIDKNHGIILTDQDIAKLPSAYGTTVFEETNDQYIITDHFTNNGNGGTISQDIFLKPTDPNIVFSYGKTITNISLVKNDDPNSIKTLAVSVIAPEQDLNEVDLDAGNLVYNNRNVEYSGNIYLLKSGTTSDSLLNQNFEELIVQLPDLSYFTPSTLTLQNDKSVSVRVVDGKATFERDQLDELLDDDTYTNFKLILQGKFNVPQDQFKDSKYDVSENSNYGLNLIYKNGYGSINGLIVLKNVTVIDDQTRLTADVALKSRQNFDALFADNDYSRDKISEDTIEVYQQHSNDNYDDVLVYYCGIRNNLGNQDLKNVKLHIEVPDGLNIDTLNIGGEGNVNVKLQDGKSKTLTAADFKPDDDFCLGQNIVAVDVEIPTLSSSQYFPIWLKNSDEKPISKTYLNGTPTKIGDLLTGKMTISADDYDPITVDNIYVRLIDHNIKHGIDLGIDQDQESTTPGVLNAGRLSYTAKDYNSNYLMDLKSPIVYIQIPENASIQDLSKIYVNVNNGDLKPKAISLLTVDGHEFLKVDLSNCDLIERELNIQVPYSNIPDIQTSSKNSAFLVVSDSVSDQLLDYKANHFDPNSTDPDDEPFKSLVQHEGIDPANTAYVNYINYGENWEILVSKGMTSATMTKGNDNPGPSLDSTQDDHADQADTFNLYGTIINATDTPITNAVQVINIPDTSDGYSQFNPQLTGPIHIIDANTNSNLDSLAKVTYSESVANLSASAKGIPSNQLTADQVTDWSKIKSITIRMDVLKRTSARAVLTMNDPQIYDHVGKTVYMASTIFSTGTEGASDASDVVLKPLTIAAGSAASAKLTVNGQSTVKTIIHYKDDKGDDHYIELPDKAKTYNELQDTMNRSDFLQSASDLTDADKALLPTENIDGTAVRMVLGYANPTIKNSSEGYLDHYQNGTADFGQKVKYDFDQDAVVFEGAVPTQVPDTKTVTETIHYVYEDGPKAGQTAANDVTKSVKFDRVGFKNPFTGEINWNAWTPSATQKFAEVPTPAKTGYTSDLQVVSAKTVGPTDDNLKVTVTYTSDTQNLDVKFIDDSDNGKVLKTVTKSGATNADAGYSTESDIQNFEGQHYVLVSDSSKGQALKFDDQTGTDQHYVVHLKHNTHAINEHHVINETVHYKMSDGTKAPADYQAKALSFSRDGFNDEVTGIDHWNAWTPSATQKFAEVPTPAKTGYTPDLQAVSAKTVGPTDGDIKVTVTYTPDTQNLDVKFIDDSDNGKVLKTVTKSGATNADAGYNTQSDIDGYKSQHYVLVSDSSNGAELVFDNDDAVDQHYVVHLKHNTHAINEHHVINETVHYKMSDGTKAPADYQAKALSFSRDGFNDEVTGIDHWNAWTPSATQKFAEVPTPAKTGYTPDLQAVSAKTVGPTDGDIKVTVTYTPDTQNLDVKFIDDSDNGKVLKTVTKSGATNADAGYNTQSDIDGYKSQHYVLVSDSSNGAELVFDNDDAVDQHYVVHLKHNTHAINEHHVINETVHYKMSDGTKAPADYQAKALSFSRDGFNDEVTGIDHWNAWTPSATQKFAEVSTPVKKGYTPDVQLVDAITVNPTDQDIKRTVTYAPDAQKLDVTFIDDTTGEALKTVVKKGVTNADAKYSTKSDIKSFEDQHYVLVSDSSNGAELVFDNDAADQHYTVHLKHAIHAIKEHHAVNETIHYAAADGSKVPADHTANVQFDRDGFNDEVTGTDHWNAWTPKAEQTFAEVPTPAKTGYTPDLQAVSAKTVGPTDGDIKVTVTYAPDAQKLDVTFIDDTTGETLKTVVKNGVTNADAGYSTQSDIDSYKSQHYVLVSDSSKGQALKFDDQTGTDQHYTVHLKHATHAVKEHHTINETVHYTAADGSKVPADHTANVQFDRDGFNDEVTGIDHWNAWTPSATQKFAEVPTPAKTGYTPDLQAVNAKTVGPADGNINVTVTYVPDTQNLDVKFIDDSDNGKVLKTVAKSGATNTDTGYSTKSDIQNFEGQHYVLVSDSSKGQALKFDDQTGTDQHYEVHLKHNTHAINEHHTIKQTVHYTAADGSKVPADHTASVQFDRDGFNDEVTGTDHWNAWQQGNTQTFAEVPTPAKKGYTPDVQSVDAVTVNPTDQDVKQTVTYAPDAQNLDVTFVDDTTGKTLKTVVKKGVTNADAKYSTQPDIQNYEGQHYVLVSDSSNGAELVFDDDDAADQHYTVHLKHNTHAINEHHVINETVHYKMSDGTKAPADYQAQALSFSRDGFNDEVTGADHWNAWTPKAEQTFDKVVSPAVAGYAPDIDQINAQTVKPTDTDLEFTVTYTPNVQLAHVKYIDDTNHKVLTQDDLSGRTGETSGYHTADRIVEFKGQHYDLVSDNYPADGMTFDNNDKVDQNYEVHFKHGTRTDEQDVQVPRTIKYVYQNGQQAQPDHSDALKFHETKVVDLVDGHTVSDDWTPAQDFETVATPAIQGYTPDRTEIANAGIKHDHSAIAETVTYNPDAQKAVVKYIDDTTGEQLEAKDLSGVSDQSTGYNTKETINGYINQHYVLVSDDTDGKTIVFDHDDRQNQAYEVHLKHGTEPANESRIKKITVHYQYADGLARSGKASDDQTVTSLTFKRTGIHDLVTGKIAWNAWDQPAQTFAEIDSPVIGGYTPDQVKINNVSVTADSPEMTEKTVVYNADAQKLSVDFIDDTTGKTLKTVNKIGHSDESAGYDAKSDIQDFISKHYDLISDQTNGENLVFDHDDKSDQTFEVHFKHGTQDASDSCTKTLIVHYQYADKNKAADDQQSAPLTFTRKGTKDLVTGDTTWQAWDQPSQTFATVKSPTIPGYTPDQTAIDGVAVNADSPAQTEKTVTYTANAQKATVKYVDDNDANKVLKTVPLSGKTNAKSDYTTAQDIQAYKDLGYVLVSDDTKGAEIVFDNDDKHDQNFAVQLTHGTVTVTPDNPGQPGTPINPGKGSAHYPDGTDKAGLTDTVNRNITYKMSDGSKAPAAVNDQLSYTATKVIDKVTGEVIKTDWSQNQDFKDIPSPEQTGYTPDKTVVSNKDVAHDAADITEVVTYTADDQKATVTYIDDTTGKTLKTTPLSGKTKAKSGYTTAKDIQAYKDLGYVLVSDSTNGAEIVFDNDDKHDQPFEVHLKHGTVTVTPDKPGQSGTPGEPINPSDPNSPVYPPATARENLIKAATQTIHYVGVGDETPADKVQTKEDAFTRTVTIDKVTGKVLSTSDWQGSNTFGTEDTPVIDGYHADKKTAGGLTATVENPDVAETVTYAPNGKIVPVDPNGNPIPGTDTPIYQNDPNDPSKVVPNEPLPDVPGYTPVDPSPVTPTDPGKDTPVPYTQNQYGLTEQFVDEDGNELLPSVSKGSSYKNGDAFDATGDAKVINGYVLAKQENTKGTFGNGDETAKFVYKKVGKIVPVDPNGTPIPGAGTPSYQNDPNDPSKVVPNEPTPTVPGYTPETPSVTPEDPTKDTPVPYTKNETPTTPANPMNPSKPITPGMPIKSSDPSKVVPNEPRPEVPGYTPSTPDVMPADSVEPLHSQSPAVPDQTTPTNQPAESSAASEAKSATLPQTGNDANEATAAVGLGMASFSALLTLLGTHKKHRED
ncbi:YSIRK-type signal peptide-containing protein [Lactobacillus sp. MRS-253-APC-2B]|uniref:mucin-binding protein n=1 Tax=Lactobacillus sp. MRS-253-APC-2B TaxID=2725305 RepID=UPI00146A3151|nr:YSIRK-type signal peptide-containing protein [Lactobacillus sp. MRS-253-APC-2B]NME34473.1 YSIRK-type signal peptide-containing protein [Lactobacillus sp. MRS-253-APC-2B]